MNISTVHRARAVQLIYLTYCAALGLVSAILNAALPRKHTDSQRFSLRKSRKASSDAQLQHVKGLEAFIDDIHFGPVSQQPMQMAATRVEA
eukprot:CAMPEP_0119326958 /NCGR_PEP_ID=MMETSP1333-20130426/69608_1 /TAXON_ID=418940 /ORGANISM="Scyphosphaera apsteinii, Strain RCC1455" /LENGTH=90 /DNA_ID=CAMNT_0007335403 /DNA_START=44 /DNA_END=316 /DNA_ORIENTATION=-